MMRIQELCLVLLLMVGASVAQTCVHHTRTAGAKADDGNLACLFDPTQCDDTLPAPSSTGDDDDDEDEECVCVPYYLCDNDTIIDNGKGLIDIRMSGTTRTCLDPMELCCNKPDQITPNNIGTGPNGGKPLPYTPTPNLSCGQRNKGGVGFRITGNNAGEAQFGEFPWMVAVLEAENGVEKFVGGGSLIHPQVVLTAAHVVEKFKSDWSNLRIRAGEWDTQSENEIINYQQLEVKEVIIHDKFYKSALYNDIALVVLRDEVEAEDNVGTACLPAQGAMSSSDACVATGWGKDIFGKTGCYQVILKSILLPIVQRNQCEKMLRKTRLGKRFKLHTSFTCAGGEAGQDACMGDGGGPLACPIPGDEEFYEQAGIIAWGIGCGEEDVPGVYVDVSKFRDWIDEKFNERSLDTESYQRPV